MPAKKKTVKKKTKSSKSIGLWDHLKAIKEIQDPNYFQKLNDDDKKTWDSWMILRALSYTEDYLLVANELNRFYNLSPEHLYLVLIDCLPKQRTFDKFLKGANENKYEKWLVSLLCDHFELSKLEIIQYLNLFYCCEQGKQDLLELCRKYGIAEKELKTL
jgi:hypothetical protein